MKSSSADRPTGLFQSLANGVGAHQLATLVGGLGAGAPHRLPGAGVEQIDLHHHDLLLISTNNRHSVVHAVTATITIIAAVPTVVAVVVLHLTQAGFQTQIGADQQVGRTVVVQRTQPALVQRVADGFSHLRRIGPGRARRQLPVEPGPTAIAPVITRWRRIGAAIKGVGRLRRRWRQRPRLRDVRVAALAGGQPQTDQQ